MVDRLVEPGSRDRRITIQKLTESAGESHFPVETWTTLVENMPAKKIDISGRERLISDQVSAKFDTRFEINYRADMDPELLDVPKTRRVVYQGRVFDITFADHLGRKAGIELQTIAGSRL